MFLFIEIDNPRQIDRPIRSWLAFEGLFHNNGHREQRLIGFYSIKVLIGCHTDITLHKSQILFSDFSDPVWLSDMAIFGRRFKTYEWVEPVNQHLNTSAHLRWSFICGWANSNNATFQRCLQVNPINICCFRWAAARTIQNSICRSARQQLCVCIICNPIRSNHGQCCHSSADGTDWFPMQHRLEKRVYWSCDS